MRRPKGRGILKAKIVSGIYEGPGKKCPNCQSSIKMGASVIMVKNTKTNLVSIIFCTKDCQQEYEHKKLEESGFYEGA